MAIIKPRRGTGYPSGLTQGELAVDTTNRVVYVGSAGGTGITIGSHITDYVVSFNGSTGAVQGISSIRFGATGYTGNFGISAGAGITMAVSGNTLTVGFEGLVWSTKTTGYSLTEQEGVFGNSGGTIGLTLPSSAALGRIIRVSGMSGGWRINQNAGQRIHFGKASTTTGVGGYLQSTHARDAVELVCCVANTQWNVISSIGNITIV